MLEAAQAMGLPTGGSLRAYACIAIKDPARGYTRLRKIPIFMAEGYHTVGTAQQRVAELRDANPELRVAGSVTFNL